MDLDTFLNRAICHSSHKVEKVNGTDHCPCAGCCHYAKHKLYCICGEKIKRTYTCEKNDVIYKCDKCLEKMKEIA